MTLRLYNTQARAKERFEPLDPDHVRMYVCGPTVYDRAHIGNARPVIVFDVLYRLLKRLYPRVTYVRNITDVDDKIIAAAEKMGEPISAVTERFTTAFHDDMAPLGTLAPDHEPRATEFIPQMVAMIEALLARGNAYQAEGHVLFHIASMDDYGALSHRTPDDMIAGARVEVAPYKKHPADFVLWKPSAPELPGWDSPWGRGRPGWHLECSAMSKELLGESFDIHGGGQDLIFPHHENERAQSICAHDGAPFARYWVHNGYLVVEGEKMSKSLGNFITVEDALQHVHDLPHQTEGKGEIIRMLTLGTHYRKPLNWTMSGLREARSKLNGLYAALNEAGDVADHRGEDAPKQFIDALHDDMNTPLAIGCLQNLATELNKSTSQEEKRSLMQSLKAGGKLIGILNHAAKDWFQLMVTPPAASMSVSTGGVSVVIGPSSETIEALIAQRNAAREARDFAAADKIRDELAEKGIVLEDGPEGTIWRRAG